jgi:hypothetical protein
VEKLPAERSNLHMPLIKWSDFAETSNGGWSADEIRPRFPERVKVMSRRLKILLICGFLLIGSWPSIAPAAVSHFGHAHSHAYPCYGPYPDYYDFGGLAALASAYELSSQRMAYAMDRQLQLQSSLAQTADWRAINQSLQAGALSQRYNALDGGQAARDWMYEMRRIAGPRETIPPPLRSFREIMLWPTLLRGDAFAALRHQVEAPFRRAQADRKPLTAEDYQGIIRALEAMKTTLQAMKPQVLESEYAVVEDYLDDLLREAQRRLESRIGH